MRINTALPLALLLSSSAPVLAQTSQGPQVAPIEISGKVWSSWAEWLDSPEFAAAGGRCGAPEPIGPPPGFESAGDCTFGTTNPNPIYDPGTVYEIQVVVHVLEHANGNGQISDALIHSQIDILNEDFRAVAGSNGAAGSDATIQFALATLDPQGNPTTGITRTQNNNWYFDSGSYWNVLGWDTTRYLNIYTNNASGALGYVPDLAQGIAGASSDRVVVLWSSFGLNAPIGAPFNKGRTTTHEVGHYLGLYHTFNAGCGSSSAPSCYTSGDRICDTASESFPASGCPTSRSTCSSLDPVRNYMDYSDDLCMNNFSPEQINRMRCTLENYRPDVFSVMAEVDTYCVGKLNTDLCVPFMTFSGAPSESSTSAFQIRAEDIVANQNGLLIYGTSGRSSLAFHNATLCVKSPLVRLLPPKSSGDDGSSFCGGSFKVNFNNRIQSGADPMLTAGAVIDAQWIYRDPGIDSFNDGLSNGIEFVIAP